MIETPAPAPSASPAPTATPTPFPRDAAGNFTGAPADFVLPVDLLPDFTAGEGEARPNSFVLENRADGEAYLAATGRLDGWLQQYDRAEDGAGPLYVVQVVNVYQDAAGAEAAISAEWHSQVYDAIAAGQLEQLTGISGLGVQHLVWRNSSNGTIGLEMVYRNLYILLTGPAEGVDYYDFFAELARAQVDWLREHEE